VEVPDVPPAEPNAPAPLSGERLLLAECLGRYEDAGVPGLCEVLAAHPGEAPRLLQRVLLLAKLGLLPEPPAAPG
jgi:hypothetical protein